jgi:hypothetical protein
MMPQSAQLKGSYLPGVALRLLEMVLFQNQMYLPVVPHKAVAEVSKIGNL